MHSFSRLLRCSLYGFALFASFVALPHVTYGQACPITPNDGGPYVMQEGDGIEFAASPTSTNTGVIQIGWDIDGTCFLGFGQNLVSNWSGPNGIQNCLLSAYGNDSGPNTYLGAIRYTINDGTCVLTGSTDLIISDADPTGQFTSSCASPLSGVVDIPYSVFDSSQQDYPLQVVLEASQGGPASNLAVTGIANPLIHTGSFSIDTTALNDGSYTFFLQVMNSDGGNTTDSQGCTIENNPSSPSNLSGNSGSSTSVSSSESDTNDDYEGDDSNNSDSDDDTSPSPIRNHLLDLGAISRQCLDEQTVSFFDHLCPQNPFNTKFFELLFDVIDSFDQDEQQKRIAYALRVIETLPQETRTQYNLNGSFVTSTLLRLKTLAYPQQELFDEADSIINEADTYTITDGPCSPELVSKLNATKAKLEAEVAKVEKETADKETACDEMQDSINQQQKEADDAKKKRDDTQKEADDAQQEIDDASKEIERLAKEISDLQEEVQDLQDTLTNDDDITEHTGDAPLEDIQSGAAVSFDGGASWVVAHGESGVEKLTGKFDGLRDVINELQSLERQIRDKNKEKQQQQEAKDNAEKKKNDLDKSIADQNDAIAKKQNALDAKKSEHTACNDELNDLKAQAQQLNDRIDAFNAVAKQCGIQARKAYNEAKEKLENMPPEDKKAAEDAFEDSLDEDEKEAVDNPSDDEAAGGGGLGGAAEKLEDAMRGASNCPPPQQKSDGPYREGQDTKTVHGVDSLYVINAKGTRGLADQSQKDIMKDLMQGVNITNDLSTIQSWVEFGTSGNPVSLAYGYFQSAATKGIFDKLKQRQREGTLRGLPERIEIYYGDLRQFTITKTTKRRDNYVCEDGIRQKSDSEYTVSTALSECEYESGGRYRYTVNDAEVDLSGCTRGSCPNAWSDATKQAIKKTLEHRVSGGLIGTCENIKAEL